MLDCLRDIRYDAIRCETRRCSVGSWILRVAGSTHFRRKKLEARINQRIRSRNRFTRHSFATEQASSVSCISRIRRGPPYPYPVFVKLRDSRYCRRVYGQRPWASRCLIEFVQVSLPLPSPLSSPAPLPLSCRPVWSGLAWCFYPRKGAY